MAALVVAIAAVAYSPGSSGGRYTPSRRSNTSTNMSGSTRAGARARTPSCDSAIYYTPQGTSMPQGASDGALRYSWFVNLELPLSSERFAAPDHMRRYRFVVDPEPSPANPDQLPIGFTRHFDPRIGEYVLDITCAACHTGEIHVTRGRQDARHPHRRRPGDARLHRHARAATSRPSCWRVADEHRRATRWKFDRFAQQGARRPATRTASRDCSKALRATIVAMLGSGQNNPLRRLYPVHEGFGRTDALGRIGNTVFGDHLVAANYQRRRRAGELSRTCGTSGSSTGCSTTARWRSRWRATSARRWAWARSRRCSTACAQPLPPDAALPQLAWTSPAWCASSTRCSMLRPPRWPEEIARRHRSAPRPRAARCCSSERCQECHGPHVSEPARQQASAPLKPVERSRVAHRGDPAGAHRHRSDGGAAASWSAATICRRTGLTQRGTGRTRCGRCWSATWRATCASGCVKWRGAREGEAGHGRLPSAAAAVARIRTRTRHRRCPTLRFAISTRCW